MTVDADPRLEEFYDPGVLPEPATLREEKTFTDKTGRDFTLAIEVDGGGDTTWAVVEKQRELSTHWKKPERMSHYRVSETMTYYIACLMVFSVQPSKVRPDAWIPWSFEHWANLLRRDPKVFDEIAEWVSAVQARAKGELGNG